MEPLYKVLEEAMLRIAGIRLHQGKTRTWNKAGVVPNDIRNVGVEAWQPEGITVLGTPIGSELYITERMEERISKERTLWEAIRSVPLGRHCCRAPTLGEPHHENDAPEFVGSLLCGPRRRHVVDRQRVVGRGPGRVRGRGSCVDDVAHANGRSGIAVSCALCSFRFLGFMG